MRSYLPSFALRRARSLDEVLTLLAARPGEWRPFAGGTDLMVLLAAGALEHQQFVSLWGIDELRRIELGEGEISIGALATFSDVRRHPGLCAELPMLCRAAAETGGVANQNRGTVGGNIANASPAADTPPAWLAYDAELELVSRRGRRRVPYYRFHIGYKRMDLAHDEIIASVHVRRRSGWTEYYRKVGARRAQAISKICVAAAATVANGRVLDVRLAFGSVGPTPLRAVRTEEALRGALPTAAAASAAAEVLASEIVPIDDIRSTARYRLGVAQNLLREFCARLAGPTPSR